MKIQLDEAEIIARSFESMIENDRANEAATLVGKIISSIAVTYEDPNGFLDEFISYAKECTEFANKLLADLES